MHKPAIPLRSLGLLLAVTLLATATVLATAPGFALDKREQDPELLAKLGEVLTQKTEAIDPFDAQVWLLANDTRLARYVKDAPPRLRILHNVYAQAHSQALDPDLVLALMHVESFFDPYAISRVGAQGLMQYRNQHSLRHHHPRALHRALRRRSCRGAGTLQR